MFLSLSRNKSSISHQFAATFRLSGLTHGLKYFISLSRNDVIKNVRQVLGSSSGCLRVLFVILNVDDRNLYRCTKGSLTLVGGCPCAVRMRSVVRMRSNETCVKRFKTFSKSFLKNWEGSKSVQDACAVQYALRTIRISCQSKIVTSFYYISNHKFTFIHPTPFSLVLSVLDTAVEVDPT